MEVDVPFGLVARALEPLGGRPLVSGGADAGEARAAVLQRVRGWIEAAAMDAPVVVLLDDLHWADADSLDVVSFVARALGGSRVALVAAMRPLPASARRTADELVGDGVATSTTLRPLSRAGSDHLLAVLLEERPSGPIAEGAWEFARGNPYLVEQAAWLVRAHGALPRSHDHGRLPDVLLLSRLAGLPDVARRCAQAAAVLGVRFRVSLVPGVAAVEAEAADDALDALVEAGLVRPAGAGWAEFAHALVRQAVYDDLLPGRRTTLHRRAFERLSGLGKVSPAARHAVAADLLGDPRAVAVVEAAGRSALGAGAVLAAVELFREAIALGGASAPRSLHLLAGEALLAAGLPSEAAASLRAALDDPGAGAAERVPAYRSLALALAYAGDLVGSGEVSDRALALARQEAPGEASRLLVDRLHVVWQAEGPRGALRLLDELAGSAPLPTDDAFEAARLFITYCGTGDPGVAPALARLADEPAGCLVSPFEPRLVRACVLRWEERFDDDDRVLDAAEVAAREKGTLRALFALTLARCDNRILRGRPGEALALLAGVARDLPIEPLMAPAVATAEADALTHLGRLDEAAARLDGVGGADAMWLVAVVRRSVRARLLLERARVVDASDQYRELEEVVRRLGVDAPLVCRWASGAVAAHQAAGRLDDVGRVCAWLEARGEPHRSWPRMIALAGRAGMAAAGGHAGLAEDLYRQAVSVDSPMPLERAGVVMAYAEWLRSAGRLAEARPWFAQVLGIAEDAGAGALAARAGARLRASGGRRPGRRSAPGELSSQERRVAALAAEGLTTAEIAARLFVSPKTVESHLGSVYAKLGVGSKRELRGRRFPAPEPPA
ncbi:MAG: helix-turn-helix transcriptional regulator, partial [Acidimicrobiia bacterium]